MRISEILNEDPAFNTPEALVKRIRDWYVKQPRAQKKRAKVLANETFKKWALQVDRLQKGGVDINNPKILQHQLGQWASKFFKTQEPVIVTPNNISSGKAIQQFVTQLVYKRLAGVNLNDAGYKRPVPATPTTQPASQTPQPTQTAQPQTPSPQVTGAPIGAVVKVNAGTYAKTDKGWMTEKNQLVTSPKSTQYLENQYVIQQQNKRRTP